MSSMRLKHLLHTILEWTVPFCSCWFKISPSTAQSSCRRWLVTICRQRQHYQNAHKTFFHFSYSKGDISDWPDIKTSKQKKAHYTLLAYKWQKIPKNSLISVLERASVIGQMKYHIQNSVLRICQWEGCTAYGYAQWFSVLLFLFNYQ